MRYAFPALVRVLKIGQATDWTLVALLALLSAGCRPPPEAAAPPVPPMGSNVVALIEGRPVSLAALEKEVARRGPGSTKEAALDGLLHFEATLARARSAGFDREPETVAAVERLLVARFEEREAGDQESPAVTDDEVQAAYGANAIRYAVPAAFRGSILFLKLSPKAAPEQRATALKRAEDLRATALVADDAQRQRLILENSEDQATRYQGGDTGWLTAGNPAGAWEPAVVAAMVALAKPGDFAPVIETPRGLHIVRMTGTRPASVRPLSEVRDGIRHQLQLAKRAQRNEAFRSRMRAGLTIRTNQTVLDRIPTPASRESRPPPTP